MTTNLNFKTTSSELILAAMGFAAKGDLRACMNGVAILPAKCGGIVIAATDGHVLFVGHDASGTASEAMLLEDLHKPTMRKIAKKHETVEMVTVNDKQYLDDHLISVSPCSAIGRFPDVLAVSSAKEPMYPASAGWWGVGPMGCVVAGCKALGLALFSITHGEAEKGFNTSASLVRFGARQDCYALLMPIREPPGSAASLVCDLAEKLKAGGGLES